MSRITTLLVSIGLLAAGTRSYAVDSAELKKIFVDPPRQYCSAPLWVWNDMLTDEQIVGTLRDLASQNVRQAIVHPRPGLMTPYLSQEWFRLWKLALKEAERLDMNLWIYDENSYPSGFAGGLVPEAMPESRGRGLSIREDKTPPKWSDAHVAVFCLKGETFADVTAKARAGEPLEEGRYVSCTIKRAADSPWHGGRCYVDLLYPGVTQKFLEVTLDPYAREIGEQFGKRVPGVFTDEPELQPAGALPWTDDLPVQFEKRWGYKLTANLPCLTMQVGDWRRIRHDYLQTLSELFIERWGKPYYEYCEKHKLEFTGHYWEHEWPHCLRVPDNMAMYAWHQRPAIDILMNQYSEAHNAQFGNVRVVKELGSVANQLGRPRTLCEIYGAGGWDLRFEDMKRIGDWMLALGVNTLDEHLSYVTLRGARKHDHPQSFSYHEPWWQHYRTVATYFARLSAAISAGQEANNVLLLEPTTTAWLYNGSDQASQQKLGEIGSSFQKLVTDLAKQQGEFDLGSEDILARHGSVDGSALVVGQRRYTTVVLPPMTESLNTKTVELLEAYAAGGGNLLACGEAPAFVDGRKSERAASLAKPVEFVRLAELLQEASHAGTMVRRAPEDKGILYHQRRRLADGELLLLVNTSIDAPSAGSILSTAAGMEEWDAETGNVQAYPFEQSDNATGSLLARFELPPAGSLLLFLTKEKREPAAGEKPKLQTVQPAGPTRIRRIEPNVLTLDYLDMTAGGETKKGIYVLKARDLAFTKNGMEGGSPWNRAVQFKDELISKKFPPDSGFEVTYRFTIEERVPAELAIVIERPDLYTITCNGQPAAANKGEWWLDKAFGKIDISGAAKVGENAVTLTAKPMTMYHELDCAYVLGDFALKSTEHGFVIAPPQELKVGHWNDQNHPFYAAGVEYTQTFDVPPGAAEPNSAKPANAFHVKLPNWKGSVAQVLVNGKPAGVIWHQPWELDVTSALRADTNEISVVVIGTLKNTLGPHHGNPPLGSAWPGMWDKAPETGPPAGKDYSTVGYGLFKPFVLERTD